MGVSYEDANQIVKEAELRKFTDDDLLLELLRRKRLQQVRVEYISEGWRREMSAEPPREYIIPRLLRNAGLEIGEKIAAGHLKLPGAKEEEGYFPDETRPGPRMSSRPDFRYFFPLNFVVKKP